MNDPMMNDLEATPIIDCKKSTEDLGKAISISEDDEKQQQRELAELMGESVEVEEVEPVEMEKYPLGYQYELKRPVIAGSETIRVVTFGTELEGRHIAKLPMNMEKWTWAHYMSLVGACTGLHSSVLMRIPTGDMPRLVEIASSFFVNGPDIG